VLPVFVDIWALVSYRFNVSNSCIYCKPLNFRVPFYIAVFLLETWCP